jgi:beta-lactamase regulating signal transducer with metallopeptidase domain
VTYALWLIPTARLFMPTLTHTVERAVPTAAPLRPLTDPMIRESLWMARVAPPDPMLIDRIGGWSNVLIALWLSIAAGLFLSRLVTYHRDRRAILASAIDTGRLGSVRIVRSSEVASPIALGIFVRLIAVPVEFEWLYSPRQRRLVLEHELAHHRSGDLVANLFAFVLLCLQWFNPLAWLAHTAFRFDQEAACDARVLDKAGAADRADYGRAIAKAASGRALLFASALNRRNTLQRRLQSMLRNSNPGRPVAGRLLVITAIAAALPFTAGRAVHYVDVPVAPRPVAAPRGAAALASLASAAVAGATAAVRPGAAVHISAAVAAASAAAPVNRVDDRDNLTISGDRITIDGVTKRWGDLTPAEKTRVLIAARASEAFTKTDQARLTQDVPHISGQVQMAELQRQFAARRVSIASAQTVDPVAASRQLRTMNEAEINQSLLGAAQSVEGAKPELARLRRHLRSDQQN